MKNTIKKIIKIIGVVIGIFFLLLLLAIFLISRPNIQTILTQKATDYVKENYGLAIGIDYVNLTLSGGIKLEGLYLPDEYGDTLAYIKSLTVGFYPKSVYKDGKVSLRSVSADEVKAYLWTDTLDNRFCFDYITEAFASENDSTEADTSDPFDISISSIEINNSRFKYFVKGTPDTVSNEINFNYLDLTEINLDAELNSILLDGFDATVSKLNFKEKSGLAAELSCDFKTTTDKVLVPNLILTSLNTKLQISDFEVTSEGGLEGIGEAFIGGDYTLKIADSYVTPSDFSAFYAPLSALSNKILLQTKARGRFPLIYLSDFALAEENMYLAIKEGMMSDYANFDKARYELKLDTAFLHTAGLNEILALSGADSLPQVVYDLFPIGLSTKAKGTLGDLKLSTLLSSSLGTIGLDGILKMQFGDVFGMSADANISSKDMNLSMLLDDSLIVDSLTYKFDADFKMKGNDMSAFARGVVEKVHYKGGDMDLSLHNLKIDTALYTDNNATLLFNFFEPFGSVDLSSSVDFGGEKMRISAKGNIQDFMPERLGLLDSTWRNRKVSLGVDADVAFSTIDDLLGEARIENIKMSDSLACYMLGDIVLESKGTAENKDWSLKSKFCDATFQGSCEFEKLPVILCNALSPYIPSICKYSEVEKSDNNFSLKLKINDLRPAFDILSLPIEIERGSTARFFYTDENQDIQFDAVIPNAKIEEISFKNTKIGFDKGGAKDKMYVAELHTNVAAEGLKNTSLDFVSELENDVVLAKMSYTNNSDDEPIFGDLKALVTFPEDTTLLLRTFLMPSDFTFFDLWLGLEPSAITMKRNGDIEIEKFGLTSDEDKRILLVDGVVGKRETDSLMVSFDSLLIADMALKLKTGVPISGMLSGDVCLKSLLGSPRYRTSNLRIDNLMYDNTLVGDISVKSGWSAEKKGLGTRFDITREGEQVCTARGVVFPETEEMRLNLQVKELPINLAETFLSEYVSEVKGSISANVAVNGKFSAPDVNGYLYINNANMRVNYTNTSYKINDSILFTPKQFRINDLRITDDNGKQAHVNCIINHNNFRDFEYMARISLDEFLLLNNPKAKNEMVYGKFFAGGKVRLSGDERHANLEGTITNGANESNLQIVLPESETTATTYSNIVFVSKQDSVEKDSVKKDANDFKIGVNVTVDVKDNLDMGVILSRATGDNCRVKGGGNIRIEYNSELSEPKFYGTYTITDGALKMKINKLPLKPFTIEKGSNISIGGPVSTLKFDIKSLYTTRADLATLDESFAGDPSLSNTRVPAAAVLTVGGTLTKFNLGYDITLPSSGDDLNDRVKSLVNTDELKIREFAYLIALNSFYSISGNSAAVSSTMISSLASTSISSGMNTLLGDVLGSNWTVGADITSTESDMSDMEMSFTLSRSFFNNRMILSTDLGYQNQTTTNGTSTEFTNNFDLEYKLTKSGMLRLKGYRHDNDEFYRQGSSKQGVGFLFTRESPTLRGLFEKSDEIKKRKKKGGKK